MDSKFIVIEGLEGSGKTSIVNVVMKILNYWGIDNLIMTHDPGGTYISDKLCTLIKEKLYLNQMHKNTELLMFYAARIELVEKIIKPSLLNGTWVISDRFYLSTQAYQGGGRKINQSSLEILNKMFLENVYPDLTFYLDIPPNIGLNRIKLNRKFDRIEQESLDFFNRTRLRYKQLAQNNNKIIVIDASKDFCHVCNQINHYLQHWLLNCEDI